MPEMGEKEYLRYIAQQIESIRYILIWLFWLPIGLALIVAFLSCFSKMTHP